MNCEHFQASLYDYLDNTLSQGEKVAAEKHLCECGVCREAVEREALLARTLSERLRQTVEPVVLDAWAQREIVRAVQRSAEECRRDVPIPFWARFAVPLATAGLILMCGIWIALHPVSGPKVPRRGSSLDSSMVSGSAAGPHVSYSVPVYTFRKEGGVVVDALILDARSIDGALLVRN